MNEQDNQNLDAKLFKNKYRTDDSCHLEPCSNECLQCFEKVCTIICPAKVYNYNEEEKKLVVSYEKCLECGACRVVCRNIKWKYPKGGKGIIYKNS